jgi:hypothetical protein
MKPEKKKSLLIVTKPQQLWRNIGTPALISKSKTIERLGTGAQ